MFDPFEDVSKSSLSHQERPERCPWAQRSTWPSSQTPYNVRLAKVGGVPANHPFRWTLSLIAVMGPAQGLDPSISADRLCFFLLPCFGVLASFSARDSLCRLSRGES